MNSQKAACRRQFILDYMSQNNFADVSYLSRALGVSEMTIRRDLTKMEEDEQLFRVYGGARKIVKEMYEAPLASRLHTNFDKKTAIGRFAASLAEDGDVIAMDASSTALAVAQHLTANVTVVTNNLSIALELGKRENIDVVVLGGNLRKASYSTVGFEMVRMMESYHVDKAFISSKAIDIEHGLTDATVNEGEAKKAMAAASKESFFILDSTKLDTCAFYKVGEIGAVSHIITDQSEAYTPDQQQFIRRCVDRGINFLFAPLSAIESV